MTAKAMPILRIEALGRTAYREAAANQRRGGPAGSKEAAQRCTELNRTVGPTLKIKGVGGPAGSKKAVERCTETEPDGGPDAKKEDARRNGVEERGRASLTSATGQGVIGADKTINSLRPE